MSKNSKKPEWFEYWQDKTRFEITDEINKRIHKSTGFVIAIISIIFASLGYLGIENYIETEVREKIEKITDSEIKEAVENSKEYFQVVRNDIDKAKQDFMNDVKIKIESDLEKQIRLELKTKINELDNNINLDVTINKAISDRIDNLIKLSTKYNGKLAPLHAGYGKYNDKYSIIIKYYINNSKEIKSDVKKYKLLFESSDFSKGIQKCSVRKKDLWLIGINLEMDKKDASQAISIIKNKIKGNAYIINSGEFNYDTYCYDV